MTTQKYKYELTEDSYAEMEEVRLKRDAIIEDLKKLDYNFVLMLCSTLLILKNLYSWHDLLNDSELAQINPKS